ncbi:polysaccharide pyruvyl transferase family protein [Paenibacillus protaetiae]|uniref:Polysaccharide pyruvyl transferase n=1 Tax=Paenibacillus protaetiae TaxID=2509456 RepID=A0A4P6F2A5_9BACL|nr:polysaccharide pyruvyl transferase family protein [Paenibacillus protaetiae]QAY67207.1 polysaccharide pyruvyl transferase [Paenibacillus protaetiae]
MNILIINVHSARNKGDAGIVLSMIDSMREQVPGCRIRIKSRFPHVDQPAYDVPVNETVQNILVSEGTTKPQKIGYLLRLMKSYAFKIKDPDYEWADVVVSCGGGFLLAHGLSLMTLQHFIQIKAAYDYKKPVVIYSQSIGPLVGGFNRKLAAKLLNKTSNIFVRETISEKLLQTIGVTAPTEVVPDSAFCMEMAPSGEIDELVGKIRAEIGDRPLIGLTARDWVFPGLSGPQERRTRYIQSLARAIEYLERTYRAKVLLMPQVLGPNPFNDDRIISREVLKAGAIKEAELLDYDFAPRHLKYLYSKMDMFVGTRMHSNIFALANHVPTVAINYEHKTRGIMEMLKLNDYVLEINDIEPAALIAAVEDCWSRRTELRAHLAGTIPAITAAASHPARYISGLNKGKTGMAVLSYASEM